MNEDKPLNAYEAKQDARRRALLNAADAADQRAAEAYSKSDLREETSGIPLGQPILVGHHSERRHRRALEKAGRAMNKSIAETKKAAELRAKAAGVGKGGISSDDPKAIEKLQKQLSKCEADQDFMKKANALVRKAIKAGAPGHEGARMAFVEGIRKLRASWPETAALSLLEPDFAGRTGFASYRLTNNNANIKRLKSRIENLEKARAQSSKETTYQGICKVVQNVEENRLQFIFDGKPEASTRQVMKDHGFRWAPSQGAWQRKLTGNARYNARLALKALGVGA
jgi:hypothetical protein